MQRKAQTPFTIAVWFGVAALMFFMVLGPWLSDSANAAVADQSLTGYEGFFMANMPLWIVIAAVVFVMVVLSFGGGG